MVQNISVNKTQSTNVHCMVIEKHPSHKTLFELLFKGRVQENTASNEKSLINQGIKSIFGEGNSVVPPPEGGFNRQWGW